MDTALAISHLGLNRIECQESVALLLLACCIYFRMMIEVVRGRVFDKMTGYSSGHFILKCSFDERNEK